MQNRMARLMLFSLLVLFTTPFDAIAKKSCKDGEYLNNRNSCTSCMSIDKFVCKAGSYDEDGKNHFNVGACSASQKIKSKKCESGTTKTCDAGLFLNDRGDCQTCNETALKLALNETKEWLNRDSWQQKFWPEIKSWYSNNKNSVDDTVKTGIEFILNAESQNITSYYCPGVTAVYGDFPYGIKKCPEGQLATSDFKSCEKVSGTTTVRCGSGEYLPAGKTKCEKCVFDKATGKVCEGGEFKAPKSEAQGVKTCADNQIVNWKQTGCITCSSGKRKNTTECYVDTSDTGLAQLEAQYITGKKFSCPAGSYLKSKSEYLGYLSDNLTQSSLGNQQTNTDDVPYCMSCFDYGNPYSGAACYGVSNVSMTDQRQGMVSCGGDRVTTRDNPTTCINKTTGSASSSGTTTSGQSCKAGNVWFNNQCTPCVSNAGWIQYAQENRVFCPGGDDVSGKTILQQLAPCPAGSWPTADLTNCECKFGGNPLFNYDMGNYESGTGALKKCQNMTLSSSDLRCGPGGCTSKPLVKQCWTKSDSASYKKCMGFDNN